MRYYPYILAAAALALAPLSANAIPADPTPRTYTNPDGSRVELSLRGDAFFHYYSDADGNIYDFADGWLRPNGLKADAATLKRLEAQAAQRLELMGETRALATDGRSQFPTIATDICGLVVLMEFPSTPFTVPDIQNQITKMVNEEGYSDYRSSGSCRDYYIFNSNGKFAPTFDVSPVIKMNQEASYYAGSDGWSHFDEAAREALLKLDEQGWDFSKYDYDNDGIIDNVFFYFAGFGKADSNIAGTIWPHKQNFKVSENVLGEVMLDGKRFGPYACGMELKYNLPRDCKQPWLDGIGTFTHEFGHVLGFADLYDTYGNNTPEPEYMDLMSVGCYNVYGTKPPMLSAFELWQCRWLEFTDLTEPGHYTLQPLSREHQAYRLPVDRTGTLYFLIESRMAESWDASLPDHGCTFWRVHYLSNYWWNNSVNGLGEDRLNIVRPNYDGNIWCFGNEYPYTYPGFVGELKPRPKANSNYEAYITNIQFDPETGVTEFDYNLVTERPTGAPVMHDNPVADPDERDVYLTWDAVEGADNYMLSVWYNSKSTGEAIYVKGLNDKHIGNVTSYMIHDMENTPWRSELHARVRAVKGLPSVDLSNEIVFVPKELPSGIEEIGTEGFENAQWFTLTGLRVDPTTAGSGIYLLRKGAKTTKVLIP